MKYLVYITLLIFCLISCNSDNDRSRELTQIKNIIHTYPDSALNLLDSLKISSYNAYDRNRFFLYRIQAKDLAGKDISADKEILDVYDYFKNSKYDELAVLAAFYAGRVLHSNKRSYEEAIVYYNIAEAGAAGRGDREPRGYILFWMGQLMLDQYLFDEAKAKIAEAKSVFIQTGNKEYEIKLYNNIGIHYLLSENSDSSLVYLNKALDLAIQYGNRKEQARITQNIGLVLSEKGDFREAVNTLLNAIAIDSAAHSSGKVYLNVARAYLDLGRIDSARHYANFCLEEENKKKTGSANIVATVYGILSDIEEHTGNYKDALDYQMLYSENLAEILSENKDKAILEADSKYKFEVMRSENIALTVKQLETQRILYLSFLLVAVSTIIYYRKLLFKKKQLLKANEEILSLTETAKEFDTAKESYRDYLVHNFNVLKRAASLESEVEESGDKQGKKLIKQFNIVAYGKETIDWDILYNIINTVHNGAFDRIKKECPDLDETDFRICCLICSKFSSNEIATITRLSINTVHMKTTYIRKKLGIKKYGNLPDFFSKYIISPDDNKSLTD
jgi:tetratricopeptide (TPR) repeat protein/DNA-binding CsgD family transcriptional regulator